MKMKTMNKIFTVGAMGVALTSINAKADLFKCTACPAGYRCDGSNKYQCSAGTYSHAGASNCSACGAGTYSNAGASGCREICKAGTYDSNGTCKACADGYYQPNDSQSSCQACSGISDKSIFMLTTINPNLSTVVNAVSDKYSAHGDILLAIGSSSNLSNYFSTKIINPFLSRGNFTFRNNATNEDNGGDYHVGEIEIASGKTYAICRLKNDITYEETGCGSDGWCIDEFYISGMNPRECVRLFTTVDKTVTNYNPRVSCDKKTGKFMITNDLGDVVYDDNNGLHKSYLDSETYITGYNDWNNFIGYEEI